jgi:hypothetical protein
MRKLYLILFAILLSYPSNSQNAVSKITKNYFRSNPFGIEFSSFLKHLLNDPTITDKVNEKRTDSSLFFFEGTYTTHNPFFFKAKKVRIILNEVVILLDSLPPDTIFAYQLMAYDDGTKEGLAEVKKEFEKIFKRYERSFSKSQFTESTNSGIPGVTYNFFDPLHAVAPFALSWFGPDDNKDICLVLTIRMDTNRNQAILPVPFFAHQ